MRVDESNAAFVFCDGTCLPRAAKEWFVVSAHAHVPKRRDPCNLGIGMGMEAPLVNWALMI